MPRYLPSSIVTIASRSYDIIGGASQNLERAVFCHLVEHLVGYSRYQREHETLPSNARGTHAAVISMTRGIQRSRCGGFP
jgi:hypothetical protein